MSDYFLLVMFLYLLASHRLTSCACEWDICGYVSTYKLL